MLGRGCPCGLEKAKGNPDVKDYSMKTLLCKTLGR